MTRALLFPLLLAGGLFAQVRPGPYTLQTVIGSGLRGDGGPALEALLDSPAGLAEDAQGNLYIAESNSGLIRRVTPAGRIERFAGTGIIDDGPAGQPALNTHLVAPSVLLFDRTGRLLFADNGTCRIRRIERDGTIRDLAGTGRCSGAQDPFAGGGFPGGGGGIGSGSGLRTSPALETDLGSMGALVEDSEGRLVFTDATNHGVRRLDSDGLLRVVAGTGTAAFFGDGAAATSAFLNSPTGLVYDSTGRLYIADTSNCRIRRVNTDGTIETVAGSGTCSTSASFASGLPLTRPLGPITALAYERDTESIYVASPGQARVLLYEHTRLRMSSFLGNGQRGIADTDRPNDWKVDSPAGLLVSPSWGVVVSEATAFRVTRVKDGAVRTLAGAWPHRARYPDAAGVALLRPRGMCLQPSGRLVVVDNGAERILSVGPAGDVQAVAGVLSPTGFTSGDGGPALDAQIAGVNRVLCAPDGTIYFTQESRIRSIAPNGVIRTVLAGVDEPSGLALDAQGRLYYSEAGAHRVSRYDLAARNATVVAGTGVSNFTGDGGPGTSATLASPGDLALDPQGNLLIADRGNRRIRKVTTAGVISTIAGSYRSFIYSDFTGELATAIGFGAIDGLTVDAAGNIYVSEYPRLSVIAPDGRIRILTGYAGENDAGVKAYLDEARRGCDSIAVSPAGRIYLALRLEGKVISASPAPSSSPDAPRISNAGITQQGFSKPAIVNVSPRTILSIYGGPFLSGAPVVAGAGPSLPTKLGGVCVWFGAAAAPLFAVAADSVTSHGLLPGVNTRPAKAGDYLTLYALGPGVNSRPAKAGDYLTPHALGPGVNSRPAKAGDYLTLYALGPGVNSRPAKAGAYLTLYALGPGVNSRPAKAGDYLTLYALGLGDTIPAGAPTPGLARVTGAVEVKIGGLTLTPDQTLYAGLSPTWTGLYQVNVLLPQAVPDGDQPVTVSIGGIASPPGRYLTVKQQQ
jgi:sugar lactone lactonase YvrE